ncbi:hypothetical protein PsorP6_016162 [Peronosclerospora sorghi]|uniref:Uncharacterized protein n=1 Tax=Peronosclerospora sorghi TaxID=230839 RepID=A0ACC0VQ30_9STRA|nr:hypothetical protein PsorP6_016162 [Peronosclerospora sorghi]
MHYYMTGIPFVRIEEPYLLEAVQLIRSMITLPTRKDMATKLLDECSKAVKKRVDEHMRRSPYNFLTRDAWSNVKNEPVINCMLVSPKYSRFLESSPTGEQAHTAAFLDADLIRVIKSATEFADKFFQGCALHSLHLFVKDVCAATKAKRGREFAEYPTGYPFENLLVFTTECKENVKFFKNHHVSRALFKERKVSILDWWLAQGEKWSTLRHLALRVFSMVASTASSDIRNILSDEAVKKRVYIKTNNRQFTQPVNDDAISDSDDSDNDLRV